MQKRVFQNKGDKISAELFARHMNFLLEKQFYTRVHHNCKGGKVRILKNFPALLLSYAGKWFASAVENLYSYDEHEYSPFHICPVHTPIYDFQNTIYIFIIYFEESSAGLEENKLWR